jgi:hypothetical protein
MAKYDLPHFGEINTEHLETYYDSKVELGDRTIEIDLNFESTRVEAKRLEYRNAIHRQAS